MDAPSPHISRDNSQPRTAHRTALSITAINHSGQIW